MDPREQRGLELAARSKLKQKGDLWLVPSAHGAGTYVVDPRDASCSCPDFETRGQKCKHVYAVEITLRRETVTAPDGTVTTTESVTVKKTYGQDWANYNLAATHEKARVAELLKALCSKVETPRQVGRGNRKLQLDDAIFAACMKVFLSTSGRRAQSDIMDLAAKGFMRKAPCYNAVFKVLNNASVTPLLKALIEESASPLRAVETDFAIDSSGFSTSVFDRWYDEKYGTNGTEPPKLHRKFLKAHVTVGVTTHIITSVEITGGDSNDCPHLPALLDATASRFKVREVSADKGYLSRDNFAAIERVGAVGFIPFKSNSVDSEKDPLWSRLFHFFNFERKTFLEHYHKRSNVETVFSMIHAKFGKCVRSKNDVAQKNEVLLKVLCHNLCRLVAAIYELGLEPTFWPEKVPAAAQIGVAS